jgi:predicted secreted protein
MAFVPAPRSEECTMKNSPGISRLEARLADRRSRRVVFVSHCLLNQNVRYLGGAWARGAATDALAPFINEGTGLYQMPCPEQAAWGGILKRLILRFYGPEGGWLSRQPRFALPLFRAYTRIIYRRLARRVARDIEDYSKAGFEVVAIVGVGNSPSCGVLTTLDLTRALPLVAAIDRDRVDARAFNEGVVRPSIMPGNGLYIAALQRQLRLRGLNVPFREHQPPL